jgi:hypothetical protein
VFGTHMGEGEVSAANGLLARFSYNPASTGVETGTEGLAGTWVGTGAGTMALA